LKKNDFYIFLESLRPVEVSRFEKFLASPYFNRSHKILEAFKFICCRVKHFKGDKKDKIDLLPANEEIYKHLYPGKRYSDVIIRNHLSDLVKLGMDFLLFESFRDSKKDHLNYLLKKKKKRQLSS